jgi:hypothetical protein
LPSAIVKTAGLNDNGVRLTIFSNNLDVKTPHQENLTFGSAEALY